MAIKDSWGLVITRVWEQSSLPKASQGLPFSSLQWTSIRAGYSQTESKESKLIFLQREKNKYEADFAEAFRGSCESSSIQKASYVTYSKV